MIQAALWLKCYFCHSFIIMMNLRIKSFGCDDIDRFNISRNIREEVFVIEQGVDPALEYDGKDVYARHYLVYGNKKPVATARWRETTEGIKLERFAVLKNYRNREIGRELLIRMLADVLPLKKQIFLHSHDKAVNFYLRNGFKITGTEFYEADIRHFKMIYKY